MRTQFQDANIHLYLLKNDRMAVKMIADYSGINGHWKVAAPWYQVGDTFFTILPFTLFPDT
jgi:hypothetical protein